MKEETGKDSTNEITVLAAGIGVSSINLDLTSLSTLFNPVVCCYFHSFVSLFTSGHLPLGHLSIFLDTFRGLERQRRKPVPEQDARLVEGCWQRKGGIPLFRVLWLSRLKKEPSRARNTAHICAICAACMAGNSPRPHPAPQNESKLISTFVSHSSASFHRLLQYHPNVCISHPSTAKPEN